MQTHVTLFFYGFVLGIVLWFAEALHESPESFPAPVVGRQRVAKRAAEGAHGPDSKEGSPGPIVIEVISTLDLFSVSWELLDINSPVQKDSAVSIASHAVVLEGA